MHLSAKIRRKGAREHSERGVGDLDALGDLLHHERQRQFDESGNRAFLTETPHAPTVRLPGGNEVLNAAELETTTAQLRVVVCNGSSVVSDPIAARSRW